MDLSTLLRWKKQKSTAWMFDLDILGFISTKDVANTLLFLATRGNRTDYFIFRFYFMIMWLINQFDFRLFDFDDELSASVYPRITRTRFQWVRYCMTCGTHSAGWITTDNDRLPHNPCYFCDRCFKSFNYIDNRKIGNFKAYRYPKDQKACRLIANK